jgi:DNA-directed RNA polymerase subunit RPC12/RpoP
MSVQADFEVEVKDLDQNGAFPCPKCESEISPDDDSEENYVIINTKTKGDQLISLTFECKKCRTRTLLKGFPEFEQMLARQTRS